jgi:hypothetical protein
MSMPRTLFLVLALSFGVRPVQAQDSAVEVLSQRVEKLEHQVAELELRLRALEAPAQPARVDATRAAAGDWKQLANWRRLRQGMTMDDVTMLLGQPDRVNASSYLVLWYYGDISGGSITFDARSQKASGWSEPQGEPR